MLIIRDTRHRDEIPPWLIGEDGQPAPDLHAVIDADGDLYGLGSSLLLGSAPPRAWTDLGDGYQARIVMPLDSGALRRVLGWARTVPVADSNGRLWPVPVVLDASGSVVLVPRYDAQWRPTWTPAQSLVIERAESARQALAAAVDSGAPLDAAAACTWCADLISAAAHVTPAILGALQLLDTTLVLRALRIAAGYQPPEDE
jgi:hypothetical protein